MKFIDILKDLFGLLRNTGRILIFFYLNTPGHPYAYDSGMKMLCVFKTKPNGVYVSAELGQNVSEATWNHNL